MKCQIWEKIGNMLVTYYVSILYAICGTDTLMLPSGNYR